MDNNKFGDESSRKLGIFYFNSENKKVFVPKKYGMGWTLNFARWQSLLITLGTMAMILFSLLR
jgi:uncharacterized membrane protein